MTKEKIKTPKCECCGRRTFKRSSLEFGSIKDNEIVIPIEHKSLFVYLDRQFAPIKMEGAI